MPEPTGDIVMASPRPPATNHTKGTAQAPSRVRRCAPWVIIVVLGLALYTPGLDWGLPGMVSWSQDTIAGYRTIGAVAQWPDDWNGRYPPLHYFLNYAVYAPIVNHWINTGEATIDPGSGLPIMRGSVTQQHGLLFLISRVLSVAMAIAAAVGLFVATRVLTGDDVAALTGALTAAIALMIGAAYTYFAHLGNVDVPSVCWFIWSAVFYLRAWRRGHALDFALLGFFGSLAISTKDAIGGMYPGMAVALAVVGVYRLSSRQRDTERADALPVLLGKWGLGLAVFALPYLFINGVFHDPAPYVRRMSYWLGYTEGTLHTAQATYDGQLSLAWATIQYAAGAVGWPMLMAMVVAAVYCVRRRRSMALILLAPMLSYYVVVIARIDFVYSRFLLAPLALGCIMLGVALSDLLRSRRLALSVRWCLVALMMLPSLSYAVAIDVAMARDTRYAAERWFQSNVPLSAGVGAFPAFDDHPFVPQYLPRLHTMGYATYPVPMRPSSFAKPQPPYLVLSSFDYDDFNDDQESCRRELLAGTFGYRIVAMFGHKADSPPPSAKTTPAAWDTVETWLALAGWGAKVPGKISPTVIVLKRESQ